MITWERSTGNRYEAHAPTGTFGQISLNRLCETLENCGEIKDGEQITHLEIVGDMIRYRLTPQRIK